MSAAKRVTKVDKEAFYVHESIEDAFDCLEEAFSLLSGRPEVVSVVASIGEINNITRRLDDCFEMAFDMKRWIRDRQEKQ